MIIPFRHSENDSLYFVVLAFQFMRLFFTAVRCAFMRPPAAVFFRDTEGLFRLAGMGRGKNSSCGGFSMT